MIVHVVCIVQANSEHSENVENNRIFKKIYFLQYRSNINLLLELELIIRINHSTINKGVF